MKLRDIVLSATIGLGLVGCEEDFNKLASSKSYDEITRDGKHRIVSNGEIISESDIFLNSARREDYYFKGYHKVRLYDKNGNWIDDITAEEGTNMDSIIKKDYPNFIRK